MSDIRRREIRCKTSLVDGKPVASQECSIIDHLVKQHFIKVGERESGWVTLYKDPTNDAYWEHSYPHGEWQGGGPPLLTQLTEEEAQQLYGELPE
jgi:hypothetical protein